MTKQAIFLPHLLEFLVPGQCQCGKPIPDKICKDAIEKIKRCMSGWFGGCSETKVTGSWVHDDGRLAVEGVLVIYSNANAATCEAHRQDFLDLAAEMAAELGQECLACRIDRKMHLFSGGGSCAHIRRPPKTAPPQPLPPDPARERRARLLALEAALRRLVPAKGPEPVWDLFVKQLNYPHADAPLPCKWPKTVRDNLAKNEAPRVIAQSDSGFKVVLIRMAQETLPLIPQRAVIERILKDDPGLRALFAITNPRGSQWHFVNVPEGETGPGKRLLLRRFRITDPHQPLRTLVTQFDELNLEHIGPAASAADIKKAHDRVFSVKRLSDGFFRKFKEVFEATREEIVGFKRGQDEEEDRLHLFTQQLFNRLLFLGFIEKKGWLTFEGEGAYFEKLWRDYQRAPQGRGFYRERLEPLFFETLNRPKADIPAAEAERLEQLVGKAPFLNGGLFERDENDKRKGVDVPDACFPRIFRELFGGFNFTVTEATPFDEDVAVDPEMLGRVFEELVVGRHATGSYYTPKPIVAFMCREALKGHLAARLDGVSPEAIAAFVDYHETSLLKGHGEEVLDALRAVTVCDPACGSGAYLLGMLHELTLLRAVLFDTTELDALTAYDRKLSIIHDNLYGVDLEPFAVNIARLRLWLSLAVEYEGPNPPALPNLDFKIECGDSLLGPRIEETQQAQGFFEQFIERDQAAGLARLKEHFLRAVGKDKEQIRKEISKWESNIAKLLTQWRFSRNDGKPVFFWRLRFFEVFAQGGFDVVLANPPYVRQELLTEFKSRLKDVFSEVYDSTADLYCYFYARSVQILRDNGMLVFISSNKWMRARYGEKLRSYLAHTLQTLDIIDFGELPVFENAATFPMIFIAQKRAADTAVDPVSSRLTRVRNLDPPYPDVHTIVQEQSSLLAPDALAGATWVLLAEEDLNTIKKIATTGLPLKEYVGRQIYRGILTGLNEAFFIDGEQRAELIARDPRSADVIRPLALGTDIRKWRIDQRDQWMILTKIGVPIEEYPAIFNHLKQWETRLKKRQDQGEHWWELRACAYYEEFEKPKIVYPDIAKESRFTLDEDKYFVLNTSYFIPGANYYLLAILNSAVLWAYCKEKLSVLGDPDRGGRLRLFTQFILDLPIPEASTKERTRLEKLAKQCCARKGQECQDLEAEIEAIVASLYGLKSKKLT